MEWKELLGFMGGALTTVGFVTQVRRLFRLRNAHEISLPFTAFFVVYRNVSPHHLVTFGLAMLGGSTDLPPMAWRYQCN